MIGIIYKFTILVKYKMNGYKPFYVGQHVDKGDFESYWGSGSIWEDFVDKLRKKYPTCWEKFIKREVLYKHECSQKTLDKLEEYYIKKKKAHYSYRKGGCNVLWGSSFGRGKESPTKDPLVRKKMSKSLKKRFSDKTKHPMYGRKQSDKVKSKISNTKRLYFQTHSGVWLGKRLSEETKRKISESRKGKNCGSDNPNYGKDMSGKNNPNYGHKWTEEMKKRLSEKKKGVSYWTNERKEKFSERMSGSNHPMWGKKIPKENHPMYGKHHSEETKRKMREKALEHSRDKRLSELL